MADRKRPVITVVDAQPMTGDNFKSGGIGPPRRTFPSMLSVPPAKPKRFDNTTANNSSSNNVVKSRLKIFESLHLNNKTSYSQQNNVKPVNYNKPPVPAARKFISNAKSELSLDQNKYEFWGGPQPLQQHTKNKNDFGSADEISNTRSDTDSIPYPQARSRFGGNWISDKETSTPSLKQNKTTIIRPKSTFSNINLDCDQSKKGYDLDKKNDLEKPCLPRKPTIIKPKPLSRSMILLDSNKGANDKSRTEYAPFEIPFPDLLHSEPENVSQNNFQSDVKNIDLLAGLEFDMVFPKHNNLTYKMNSSDDLFKSADPWSSTGGEDNFLLPKTSTYPEDIQQKKSVRPPRPPVGPKIQNLQEREVCNPISSQQHELQGPRAVALHDYNSGHQDDLIFKAGEIIMLDNRVDETWYRGHKLFCEEQGMFPSNFVEVIQPLPDSHPNCGTTSDVQERPRCIARYNFEGMRQNGELCFKEGDLIFMLGKVNDEWLRGELATTSERGAFPTSFVEIIQDINVPQVGIPRQAVALYDFNGGQDGDLNFRAGDTIDVIREINKDWMEGRIGKRSGIFPSNFVFNQ